MKKKHASALPLLLACIAAIFPAQLCAQTTIRIEGIVTNFTDVSSTSAFKSLYPVGTNLPFVATFTYDPTVADTDAHSYIGYYAGAYATIPANSAFSATFDAGGQTFHAGYNTGGTAAINVYDNSPNFGPSVDGFDFTYSGGSGASQNGFNVNSFAFRLSSSTNLAIFGSDLLSNVSSGTWSLSDFNPDVFPHQVYFAFSEGWLTGSVSSFSVSAIPEPSTYAAFAGLGALGLAIWRRKRQVA